MSVVDKVTIVALAALATFALLVAISEPVKRKPKDRDGVQPPEA